MTFDATVTIGEVALELPHAARVFAEAGRERAREAPHTLGEAPLTKLIAYVVDRHHVFTREELLRLDALFVQARPARL